MALLDAFRGVGVTKGTLLTGSEAKRKPTSMAESPNSETWMITSYVPFRFAATECSRMCPRQRRLSQAHLSATRIWADC